MTPFSPKPEPGTRQKIEAVITKVVGFIFVGLILALLAPWLAAICFLWPVAILAVVVISAFVWQIGDTIKAWEEDERRIIREELKAFKRRNF
jgi:hypothetical protein